MNRKEKFNIGQCFSEAFSIPADVIANETLMHIVGDTEILIQNFRGILAYTCQEIVIKGFHCKVVVMGKCLSIVYYSDEEMKISGKICDVKIIK